MGPETNIANGLQDGVPPYSVNPAIMQSLCCGVAIFVSCIARTALLLLHHRGCQDCKRKIEAEGFVFITTD